MILKLKVIAGAKENKIEEIGPGYFKVRIKEKAIEGRANKALIDFLAERFNCKKSEISLVKGKTSSIKLVEINNSFLKKGL